MKKTNLLEQQQTIPFQMEPTLAVTQEELFVINRFLPILWSYYKVSQKEELVFAKNYIDSLLHSEDLLYKIIDLESIYFSLVDTAMQAINKLLSEGERPELANYCDQAAIILQTAVCKTQQPLALQKEWQKKSFQYRKQAEKIRGEVIHGHHFQKMEQLHLKVVAETNRPCIKESFLANAAEMRKKVNALGFEKQQMFAKQNEDDELRVIIAQNSLDKKPNYAPALYDMAIAYHYGAGVPPSLERALPYYQRAAEQGHAGACWELAQRYAMSMPDPLLKGTNPNPILAAYYVHKGIKQAKDPQWQGISNYDNERFVTELHTLQKSLPVVPISNGRGSPLPAYSGPSFFSSFSKLFSSAASSGSMQMQRRRASSQPEKETTFPLLSKGNEKSRPNSSS